jgi:hypothetical protein
MGSIYGVKRSRSKAQPLQHVARVNDDGLMYDRGATVLGRSTVHGCYTGLSPRIPKTETGVVESKVHRGYTYVREA